MLILLSPTYEKANERKLRQIPGVVASKVSSIGHTFLLVAALLLFVLFRFGFFFGCF